MKSFIDLGGKLSTMKKTAKIFTVLLVLITAFVPAIPFAFGQSYSYVHGYVVDENGEALAGVTVEVVSGGVIVATTFTNPNGYFVMNEVPLGSYSVLLKKAGYADATKSASIYAVDCDLGTTEISKALSLSTSTLSLVSSPGTQVVLAFTVRNSGSDAEIVDFSVSKPDGWSTRVKDSYEIKTVSLAAGQSMPLSLEIIIPSSTPVDGSYDVSLTASGITDAVLNFTILTRSQITASISGKVVDDFGNPIQSVTLDAYTPDGVLIQSVTTSATGNFVAELPIETSIHLYFSKTGYDAATKSVTLTAATENLELGEIVLSKSLTLSTSILNTVAYPGEKLLIPFDVSNNGEEQEVIQFSVSAPSSWSTKVLDQNDREVRNAILASGGSLSLQLEVTIPTSASGTQNLTLSLLGETVSSLDFVFEIEPSSESVMSCQFPGLLALPGDPVSFPVTVTNPFGFEARFRLSVDSVPVNWTSSISVESGAYATEVVLGAGESATFDVEVDSPTSSATGKTYEFSVNLESGNQQLDSLILAVSLVEPEAFEEIVANTKYPEVTVEAGELVEYQVTLGNFGDQNRLLFLSINPPANWKAVFKSGTLEITQLDLSPMSVDGVENLVIEVTPPSTTPLGTYSIPVQIQSETGLVLAELELKATIVGSFKLGLSASTLLTKAATGETASFTMNAVNIGYSTLNVVGLDIDVEEGWTVEFNPVQMDLLKPGEAVNFDVKINVPSDAVAGDYLVTLIASSDEIESSPVQVRITVSAPTSWGLWGFGIAAFIIIVLVLVFKKFKRR